MASLYRNGTVRIYGLCDPRTGHLRYVGKTALTLEHRLGQHLSDAKGRWRIDRRSNWISSLILHNQKPEIFLIEEVPEAEWCEAEPFWIQYFRFLGCDLCNLEPGGIGQPRARESRKKMSESLLSHPLSPINVLLIELRQKYRENTVRKPKPPTFTGKSHTEETRAKLSEHAKRRAEDPEYRQRQAEISKRNWTPEKAAKMRNPGGYRNSHPATRTREFIVTLPSGEEVFVRNLCSWCDARGLKACSFYPVLKAESVSYKGHKIRYADQPAPQPPPGDWKDRRRESSSKDWIVTTPEGEEIPVRNLVQWCKSRGLTPNALGQVAQGRRPHHRGYKARFA